MNHRARRFAVVFALLIPGSAIAARWSPTPAAEVQLLPVDQAFHLLPVKVDGRTLHLEWAIAPGYFLYRKRLGVTMGGVDGALPVRAPAPLRYAEPGAGTVEIYRDDLRLEVDVPAATPLSSLQIHYQGCSDAGVCYPPQTRTLAHKGDVDVER